MKKKLVYIGIILIAAAFVAVALSGKVLNVSKLVTEKNLSVASGGFAYEQLTIANGSIVFLVAKIQGPANFYVFNDTGFSTWTGEVDTGNSPNGYLRAAALDGAGAFFTFRNVSEVLIPSTTNLYNSTPTYEYNRTGIVPAGTYYAVVDNTNGSRSSASRVNATVFQLPQTGAKGGGLSSFIYGEEIFGLTFFILLVAGIVLLIYGLIKKDSSLSGVDRAKEERKKIGLSDEQVDELYKNIKGKKGK